MKTSTKAYRAAVALLLGLATLCGLAACTPRREPTATTAGDATTAAPTTEEATTAATTAGEEGEPVLRYDYFAASVRESVSLPASLYTDMQLTLPAELQVTDEDVQDYVQALCYQHRQLEGEGERQTDKPLTLGDTAYIYYKGYLNGEAFEGGSNWEESSPYGLGLGSGAFIPGFEEGLIGVIPAETSKESPAEISLTFPADYPTEELAGQSVIFRVSVSYAIAYTLPAYDREFVLNTLQYQPQKEFYAGDAALLAEFEAYLKEYLQESLAADIASAKTDAVWEYLISVAQCENLPADEIDYYYKGYVEEVEYYYEYNAATDQTFKTRYPTLDVFARDYWGVEDGGDWKDALLLRSTRMVRRDMVTHAIAEQEGFEVVTDAEYAAELAYWEDAYQGYLTAEELETNMGEATIRESALSAKVLNWLLERATFTYADASGSDASES